MHTRNTSIYALIDCNNFYVSCERVFAPELSKQPVVVLSNNDGCVIARSNEVKQLDIPVGTPAYQAESLLKQHQVKVFSSNYTLYGDMSQRVMAVLRELCPQVEQYSIDEAFLNLSHYAPLKQNSTADMHACILRFGQRLISTIYQYTGIPTSVGFGPNKTLAKIANQLAKYRHTAQAPHVFNLSSPAQRAEYLSLIPVQQVWGIGKNLASKLAELGVNNAQALADIDIAFIRKRFGITVERTVRELRGENCLANDSHNEHRNNIMSSRSFGNQVVDLRYLKEAISEYTSIAAEKLRRQTSHTQSLSVYVRTHAYRDENSFYKNSAYSVLPFPSNNTALLIKHACKAVEQIYKPGLRYQKAGIILHDTHAQTQEQFDLLQPKQNEPRNHRRMHAIDTVNHKHGRNTLMFAASGIEKPWSMRSSMKSPRYTTRWEDLPVAKAC